MAKIQCSGLLFIAISNDQTLYFPTQTTRLHEITCHAASCESNFKRDFFILIKFCVCVGVAIKRSLVILRRPNPFCDQKESCRAALIRILNLS